MTDGKVEHAYDDMKWPNWPPLSSTRARSSTKMNRPTFSLLFLALLSLVKTILHFFRYPINSEIKNKPLDSKNLRKRATNRHLVE